MNIPFAAHEAEMARAERTQKRLVIIIIILIILLVATNITWLVYENQFTDSVITTETTQTVNQEADNGKNEFIGGDYYGETDSNN